MHVKDKSCNNPEKRDFIIKRLQHGSFTVSIPKILESFFYRSTTVAAFELRFEYQKEFLTKKVSGETGCDLISLFYVEMQELTRRSTTTRAFVFPAKFYYQKIFETGSR